MDQSQVYKSIFFNGINWNETQEDKQFASVSICWKVINQTDQQQAQNPIATNSNNNSTSNESIFIISDTDLNAISEHESNDDAINEMGETIKNWNEKKTEQENIIYNTDNNLFDYEINMQMHDKEYQSLIYYKSNLKQISFNFHSESSDKRINIDINNDNDDIENGNMESKAYETSPNNNDNNSKSFDNDINEYKAKLEEVIKCLCFEDMSLKC